MRQPDSYQQHRFTALQTARAAQAFGVRLERPPRESFVRVGPYDIHVDQHEPAGEPRGTVLLVHGAGGHGRLLSAFAAPFVASGWRVLAPDLPLYGLTRVHSSKVRYADWVELVAQLASQQKGPVVLCGLSVGGITALRAAQRCKAVTGVVATTLLDLSVAETFDACARTPWLGRCARLLFRWQPDVLLRVRLPLGWLTPIAALTSDPQLARLLCEDPLLGKLRVELGFLTSLHTYRSPNDHYDLHCPLLFVHPGCDQWTPTALSMPVYEAVRSEKQLRLLSNGAHAPLERPAYQEFGVAVQTFLSGLSEGAPASAAPTTSQAHAARFGGPPTHPVR